jgi:hypothetical protein
MPDQPEPFAARFELPAVRAGSSAIETLVRQAMAAGAVYFAEKAAAGEIDPRGSMGDSFGGFPAEFIEMRSSLVADVIAEVRGVQQQEAGRG